MIDIRKLKELVRLMVANELTELDLRDTEEQVTLRRQSPTPAQNAPIPAVTAVAEAPPAAPIAAIEDDSSLITIESPMVGTFYTTSDPDAQPFVTVGSSIGDDTVICIIEAMKIFNEIKAQCTGTIHRILVKNGEPVEFGQELFLVKSC